MSTPSASAAPHRLWVTDLLLLLMAAIWGVNFSVVKFGLRYMEPLAFNAVRVVLAGVTLLLIARLMRLPLPPRRQLWGLLALGVLGHGVYQVLFVEGMAHTRAGNASLVMAGTPVLIAVLGRLRGVERLRARAYAGIALSIVGIGAVMSGTAVTRPGDASLFGDLLILASSASWATYTVLLKPYTHDVDGVQVSALTLIGGALPLAVVSTPSILRTDWVALPAPAWGAILYGALFALVIAYLIWYRGIRLLGPTRTSMFSNLQPIIAVLFAWAALGEVPTFAQGLGAAAVLTGLLLTRS
ncbi:MAG: EamA family transporter [Gemmatimonadetes bacterium]|nr:EamA family transporter [Gemmatimonadota bacterium]